MAPGPARLRGRRDRVGHRAGNKADQDLGQQPIAPLAGTADCGESQSRSARLTAFLDMARHHTLSDQPVEVEPHRVDVEPYLFGQLLNALPLGRLS